MTICLYIFSHGGAGDNLPNKENYIVLDGYDGVMGRIHHYLVEYLDWDGISAKPPTIPQITVCGIFVYIDMKQGMIQRRLKNSEITS